MIQAKIQEPVEVMNALEFPVSGNQEPLEIAFNGFLQKFYCGITDAPSLDKRISALQPLFSKQDPVTWIVFPSLQKSVSPLVTIVS